MQTVDNLSNGIIKEQSGLTRATKIPVLMITINKKYNAPGILNDKNHKEFTSNATDKVAKFSGHETTRNDNKNTSISNVEVESNVIMNRVQSTSTLRAIELNLVPVVSKTPLRHTSTVMEEKHGIRVAKTCYTRKGDSRRNITRPTSMERFRYLYIKAQRDCDVLRIRLRALREKYRDERVELKKLRMLSQKFLNDVPRQPILEDSQEYSKRKNCPTVFDDREEERECEKLLKKIKKVKQFMLNQKDLFL